MAYPRISKGLRGVEAEAHLRSLLRARIIDYDTTEEAAKKAGLSIGVTLRLLHKIHDEGFVSDDGANLVRNEIDTRTFGGRSGDTKRPKRFAWMFM